ncbi:MAG: PAS domain-containing protein [Candidatus Marinimicrobia bacterium]|jgi:signal transduction histidine kinase/regulator of replication initiation timing|nr:PAS domain-containing protein [Candidatus Neomarinimicrobiota bacterium]MBT3759137.1 PAS domain-containing protein [Candidatus Neomarinimicrobiota bacterium]MBT3895590.1 PAS domain-containing protein [Candidatus Neomarinimicrobiota bacterium]MBT4537108.1 PAS domain-containing protein [Candidatus Neomarinimicrobiota bacterium]MBT5538726.1 PAS domain-containing protein [Candidatus Neomarinimicrobiota bacterium]
MEIKHKNTYIKQKILIPLAAVLFFLLSTSVFSIFKLQNRHITDIVQSKLIGVQSLFEQLLEDDTRMIDSQIDYLYSSASLKSAWLHKDRARLYNLSLPIFNNIHEKYSITHFYYISTDRECILRLHNPDKYGDIIDRFTLDTAIQTGNSSHGIELGTFGTFTLRVVRPWLIDGIISGYIELGMEITHLTPKLKNSLGSELYLAIEKKYLSKENWIEGQKMMAIDGNWDEFQHFVIVDRTNELEIHQLDEKLNLGHTAHKNEVFSGNDGKKKYRGGTVPIIDAGGRDIGDIVVMNDITEEIKDLYSFIIILAVISFIISQVMMVFFHNYIGGIEDDLVNTHDELTREIDQHKQTEKELNRYQDHLKDLVREATEALNISNKELKDDINKRKKVEKELKKQTNFVMNLYESLSHPFYVIDANDYSIVMANSAASMGDSDDCNTCYKKTHNLDEPCSSPDYPCLLDEVKKSGKPVNIEHIHIDKNGESQIHDIHGYPIFDDDGNVVQMIEYVLDITEKRRMEEEKNLLESQLNMSQKLETIGELVDTVAHEINTPAGIIAAHADALLIQMEDGEKCADELKMIRKQTRRISKYTRSLLEYSRRVPFQPVKTDIPSLMDECLFILGHRFRALDISIIKSYHSDLPELTLDKLQIEQVFINLLNNAIDAISKNGKIEIFAKANSNSNIIIEIKDNGHGILESDIEKVFDSFFTTKSTTRGTGLGLSITKAIIQRHNGEISVRNISGSGAAFTITLPIINGDFT